MRLIVQTDPGVLELNFMWLPSWLGMNREFQVDLQRVLAERFKDKEILGAQMTEETLDKANEIVLDAIVEKYPVLVGLREYLDGLKFVEG